MHYLYVFGPRWIEDDSFAKFGISSDPIRRKRQLDPKGQLKVYALWGFPSRFVPEAIEKDVKENVGSRYGMGNSREWVMVPAISIAGYTISFMAANGINPAESWLRTPASNGRYEERWGEYSGEFVAVPRLLRQMTIPSVSYKIMGMTFGAHFQTRWHAIAKYGLDPFAALSAARFANEWRWYPYRIESSAYEDPRIAEDDPNNPHFRLPFYLRQEVE